MDNIRYGRLDATDEECIQAAKTANAHSFIRRLPDGYQTMVTGDGANLSQGQRQLLAIARAAVADPPVMVLDEATSSIDTRTEALISQGMDALMENRTVFVIAHRLSTVRNAKCGAGRRPDHRDRLSRGADGFEGAVLPALYRSVPVGLIANRKGNAERRSLFLMIPYFSHVPQLARCSTPPQRAHRPPAKQSK